MPSPWTHESELKLLVTIISAVDTKSIPPWTEVAAKMGPEFTGEAVRQRFAKLKRKGGDAGGTSGASGADTPNDVGTPTKKTPRRATPSKRKVNGDGELPTTPTPKKRKAAVPKSAPTIAKEDDEDDRYDLGLGESVKALDESMKVLEESMKAGHDTEDEF